MTTLAGTNCPTCQRPLSPLAGSSLLTCAHCQKTHVPVAAAELSLIARTQVGETRPVATIPLTREFRERYELGEVLGAGAMGMVCRALDRVMQREVAVKFLMLIDQPEILQRFLQEGRLLARVRHPNVVPVYDLEVLGGHPYIVTECLEGGTLRSWMAERSLTTAAAIEMMAACLDGLAACHASQIIHRDLKPENILFSGSRSARGSPKIGDLGIAKELAGTDSVTRTGALVGTPMYMAPEQAELGTATFASDVHAMGAMLFEAVAGHPPFVAGNLADLLRDIIVAVPPTLDTCTSAALPPALVRVVARALAKRPEDRPGVEEFASELRKAAESRALNREARPVAREVRPSTPRAGVTIVAPRAGSAGRTPPAGALAVLVAITLVLGAIALRISAPTRVPPPLPEPARPSVKPRPSLTANAIQAFWLELKLLEDERQHIAFRVDQLLSRSTVVSAISSDPVQLMALEQESQKLHERLTSMRVRLRHQGDDAEAAWLPVVALNCHADLLDWQNRLQQDGLARIRQSIDQSRHQAKLVPLMLSLTDATPRSVESCVELQRILRRIRGLLSRDVHEFASAPSALERLMLDAMWLAALVDRTLHGYYARIESYQLIEGESPPGSEEAHRFYPVLMRANSEFLESQGPSHAGDGLQDRVVRGLWMLHATSAYAQSNPRWAGLKLPPGQLKHDLLALEAELDPGALAGVVRSVELEEKRQNDRARLVGSRTPAWPGYPMGH